MADKLISSNLNGYIFEDVIEPCSFNTSAQYKTVSFSGNVKLAVARTALAENVYSAYLPTMTIINISGKNVTFLYKSAVAGSFSIHIDAIVEKT